MLPDAWTHAHPDIAAGIFAHTLRTRVSEHVQVVTVWPTSGAPVTWSLQSLRDACRSAKQA